MKIVIEVVRVADVGAVLGDAAVAKLDAGLNRKQKMSEFLYKHRMVIILCLGPFSSQLNNFGDNFVTGSKAWYPFFKAF